MVIGMNRSLGIYAGCTVVAMILLFALSMIFSNINMSYLVSMVLSWAYILLVCSLAAECRSDRNAFAVGAVSFACLYAVFVDLVYFTQLTTVWHRSAPEEALQILSYQVLGSWLFNLDLFGYAMMAISTFLIGVTITPADKADKWLKNLLLIHGIFSPPCLLMPMLNVFNADMGGGGNTLGTAVLLFWCVYFMPIGILSVVHFRKLVSASSPNK